MSDPVGESTDVAVTEAQPEGIDAAADPLEEFRESLRSKPGEWFVVHTYSGMENRVKNNLENRIGSLNMEDFIYEVHVPQEDVSEIKNGQRRMVRRTVPGLRLGSDGADRRVMVCGPPYAVSDWLRGPQPSACSAQP